MPIGLRHEYKASVFGSLNTGEPAPELREDESPLKENWEHDLSNAISRRNGRALLWEVADIDNVRDNWPRGEYQNGQAFKVTELGSNLSNDEYYVAVTYLTDVGETDDAFSYTFFSDGSPLTDRTEVLVRYHIEGKRVLTHVNSGGSMTIRLENDAFLDDFWDDAFIGWRLYARDPMITDETGLGSVDEGRPLTYGVEIAVVTDYDSATKTFTFDRSVDGNLTSKVIDLLMPDADGMKIRGFNVYCGAATSSTTRNNLRYIATGRTLEPVVITAVPNTADEKPPSLRLGARTAPSLVETTVYTTDADDGRRMEAHSGLRGGHYRVRSAWRTASSTILEAPGENATPYSVVRQAWPSARKTLAISDGKGITVSLGTQPDGTVDADILLAKLDPTTEMTFESLTNPSSTDRIYKTTADIDSVDSLSPSDFRASASTSELSSAEYAVLDDDATTDIDLTGKSNKFQIELQVSAGEHTAMGYADWDADAHPSVKNTSSFAGAVGLEVRFSMLRGTNYNPKNKKSVKVRYWNGSSWVNIKTEMAPSNHGRRETYRCCVDYANATISDPRDSGRFIFDIVGLNSVGLSLVNAKGEFYYADDPQNKSVFDGSTTREPQTMPVQSGEYLVGRTSDSLLIQNPLPQGRDWQCRTNTTGQWLVDCYDWQLVGEGGVPGQRSRIVIACGGALFDIANSRLKLRRFYQAEDDLDSDKNPTHDYLRDDFRFTHRLDRLFFTHPSLDQTQVYDGRTVRPWGCPTPEEGKTGQIRILEVAGKVQGDHLYYYTYEREVKRDGEFGYNVQSEPALIGQVASVVNGRVRLSVNPPMEPWVTHIGYWRTANGGSQPFLLERRPVDGLTEDGMYVFEDGLADDEMTLFPLRFETGRPPKARLLNWMAGRIFFVPEPGDIVAFTNISDSAGELDPEGFSPRNQIVPRLPDDSVITAIGTYASDKLVVHTDNGGVIISNVTETSDNPSDMLVSGYHSNFGAVGPKAFHSSQEVHAMTSREGPSAVIGGQGSALSDKVSGSWARTIRDRDTFRFMRVLHNRSNGKSQLIFTIPKQGDELGKFAARALVLDLPQSQDDDNRLGSLWSEWKDWPVHGLIQAEDEVGDEFPMVGDHVGRVHRADYGWTDNGLFIAARHDTKPYDDNEYGLSDQYRFLLLTGQSFHRDQYVHMNMYPDMSLTPLNDRPYRFDFSPEFKETVVSLNVPAKFVAGGLTPVSQTNANQLLKMVVGLIANPQNYTLQDVIEYAALLAQVQSAGAQAGFYDEGYDYNNGVLYADETAGDAWQDRWVTLGGTMLRARFSFFLSLDALPPGAPIDTTATLTSFKTFTRMKGPRPSPRRDR